MRSSILLALTAASLIAPAALADIGPPPTCPEGQHREYLYGHRCVDDGYHLELDEQGNPVTVKNAPAPTPAPETTPATTDEPTPAEVTPEPEAEPTPAEVTPEPEAEPTPAAEPAAENPEEEEEEPSSCSVAASAPARLVGVVCFLLAAGLVSRRV